MRCLFLDIDGCLNSRDWFMQNHVARMEEREKRGEGAEFAKEFCHPLGHLCPELIERLNRIVELTDCRIVISSAWRIGHTPREIGGYLTQKGFRHADKIIGATGQNSEDARGGEIQEWLDEHPEVTKYVILDDDTADIIGDYTTKKHPHNFVHVSFEKGLQDEHIRKCVEILN